MRKDFKQHIVEFCEDKFFTYEEHKANGEWSISIEDGLIVIWQIDTKTYGLDQYDSEGNIKATTTLKPNEYEQAFHCICGNYIDEQERKYYSK